MRDQSRRKLSLSCSPFPLQGSHFLGRARASEPQQAGNTLELFSGLETSPPPPTFSCNDKVFFGININL